jgi:phosphate transport system substrate-binding protein
MIRLKLPSFLYTMGLISLLSAGCGTDENKTLQYSDTPDQGTIHISVDESFKPIIDSQIQVYESQHPNTHIIAEYKSEAECYQDLGNDSTRMIIVTRHPTQKEFDFVEQKYKYRMRNGNLAYDAIGVVVNKGVKDSLFTVAELKSILSGTDSRGYKAVLDGLTATSNVRYVLDSILRGTHLGKNVSAARTSQGVIDYVGNDPSAIGFVGVSWVGVKEDSEQLTFSTDTGRTKLASLQCETCPGRKPYVLPYLANIGRARYPLIRTLVYVLRENGRGLGSGFLNFLTGEKGQLIFQRAYLLPAKMQFEVRDMNISEE